MGKAKGKSDDTIVDSGSGPDTIGGPADADNLGADLAPDDPAVTGIPRDERHDSIDPAFGTLTDEAVALRAARSQE